MEEIHEYADKHYTLTDRLTAGSVTSGSHRVNSLERRERKKKRNRYAHRVREKSATNWCASILNWGGAGRKGGEREKAKAVLSGRLQPFCVILLVAFLLLLFDEGSGSRGSGSSRKRGGRGRGKHKKRFKRFSPLRPLILFSSPGIFAPLSRP